MTAIGRNACILALGCLWLAAACAAGTTTGQPDASPAPIFDAVVGVVDAAAPIEEPDAPIEEPDAPIEEPDAPIEEPDASIEEPDASIEEPDAAATVGCIPECYVAIVTPLITACPTTGTCTAGASEGVFTLCFDNGVKIVTVIGESVVQTFKNPEGVCFSIESIPEGNGGTSYIRDATGTVVARVVTPDRDEPNKQQYHCGDGPAIDVDLDSPECQAERGDAGVSDGVDAGTCTFDDSCEP
jgi:hypothetical protein